MDCWSLVRTERPDWPVDRWAATDAPRLAAITAEESAAGRWVQRWPPQDGDILLMGPAGTLTHAGLYRAPGNVLHWHRRHGRVIQPLAVIRQLYSRVEAWAWAG